MTYRRPTSTFEVGDRVVHSITGLKGTIEEDIGHSVRVRTDGNVSFFWTSSLLLPEPPLEALARLNRELP